MATELKYAKSPELEKQACDSIIELFSTLWDDTQKKSSREITAMVVDYLIGACLVKKGKRGTTEHLTLLYTNQYLEKVKTDLLSSSTLPYVVSGKTIDDIIKNLDRIRLNARDYSNYSEISKQLKYYISILTIAAQQYASSYKSKLTKSIITSLSIGCLLGYLGVKELSYFPIGTFLISSLCYSVACFAVIVIILRIKQNNEN